MLEIFRVISSTSTLCIVLVLNHPKKLKNVPAGADRTPKPARECRVWWGAVEWGEGAEGLGGVRWSGVGVRRVWVRVRAGERVR